MNRTMTNPGVNATRSAAHVIATTGHDGNERALPLSLALTCQRPGTDRNQPGAVGATRHDTTEQGEARHGASRPAWSYHQPHRGWGGKPTERRAQDRRGGGLGVRHASSARIPLGHI
jgi:hypothetical protein